MLEAYRVLNNPTLRKDYDLHQHQEMKQTELHWNRYLEQTNLIEKDGKMYVECEQCLGVTEVVGIDMLKLIAK